MIVLNEKRMNFSFVKHKGIQKSLHVCISLVCFILLFVIAACSGSSQQEGLTIIKNKISTQASFFTYKVDTTEVEIIAVKASDGSIRTVFNACEPCSAMGMADFSQDGQKLLCKSCIGEEYLIDDIEINSGGCFPVPITKEQKSENNDSIFIPAQILKDGKKLFVNNKDKT